MCRCRPLRYSKSNASGSQHHEPIDDNKTDNSPGITLQTQTMNIQRNNWLISRRHALLVIVRSKPFRCIRPAAGTLKSADNGTK